MPKIKSDNALSCHVETTLNVIAGRWKVLIIHQLLEGEKRFNQLQRELGNITHRTLAQQLRDLERDKIIMRHDHGTIPPRVDYALTTLGASLKPVLNAMHKWGKDYPALSGSNSG